MYTCVYMIQSDRKRNQRIKKCLFFIKNDIISLS